MKLRPAQATRCIILAKKRKVVHIPHERMKEITQWRNKMSFGKEEMM
jgi:hypothetical protein